jgi:MFS family permease
VLLLTSIFHLTNDGGVTVLAGQLALIQVAFRLSPLETGTLVGTAFLVSAICQLLLGVVSDRLNPSSVLPLGLVVLGAASILVSASQGFIILLVTIAAARIGASFYHPVGLAWIGRTFPTETIDRPMGIQSSFGDIGVILGLATGAILGVQLGWGAPFILWGIVNLAAAAYGVAVARGIGRSYPPTSHWGWNDARDAFKSLGIWLFPITAGYSCYSILSYFGPVLLHAEFGMSVSVSGICIALWIVVGAAESFLFGKMSRAFGRYRIVVLSFAMVALASLVAAFSESVTLTLVAVWVLASAVFLTFPGVFSYASASGSERSQGATFGLVFFFQLIGGAISSFLAGALSEHFAGSENLQLTIPFMISATFGFCGCLYMGYVRKRLHLTSSRVGTA